MKKAILHISDLHVASDSSTSYLYTSSEIVEQVNGYQKNFIESKEEQTKEYDELILIISGDISNKGLEKEFAFAKSFIEKLNIKKENTLIIPGNHDINWIDNGNAWQSNQEKKPYEFQKEKFQKFKSFYDSFYVNSKTFNPEKIIVDVLKLESEKLLIIGLNSCYKCNFDNQQGIGFIDYDKLEEEIKTSIPNSKEYSKIAVCHHNPFANYTEHPKNSFEDGNWQMVKRILMKYGINAILFGHEHTQSSDRLNDYDYISVGSLSKKDSSAKNEFYLIDISDNDEFILAPKYFGRWDNNHKDHPHGQWKLLIDGKERTITLRKKIKEHIISSSPLPFETELVKITPPEVNRTSTPPENPFAEEIFKKIQEQKLFKFGHFHWSETSRAHNWIDTPKLLNKKENIFLIQKSILKSIEDNNIKFDLIIGLGIEGNIIATRCAMKYNVPYTYLPYSYRYKDHTSYEKELKLNRHDFKKILIVTDVVHDGGTIKNILKDENDFFKKCSEVEEINVVSLFFTGDKEMYNINMLNEGVEKRFRFYFVSQIRVEECPYKKDTNWRANCVTYCNRLEKIYEFYNEKENGVAAI